MYEWALIATMFVEILAGVHPVHQDVVLVGMHRTQAECQIVAEAMNGTEEWPYYMACYKRVSR